MMAVLLAALALAYAMEAQASRHVLDCPMRGASYPTYLPLIDDILDPSAEADVDREAPGLLKSLPRHLTLLENAITSMASAQSACLPAVHQ